MTDSPEERSTDSSMTEYCKRNVGLRVPKQNTGTDRSFTDRALRLIAHKIQFSDALLSLNTCNVHVFKRLLSLVQM